MGAVPSAIIGGICGQLGFMAARSLQSIQHEIRLIELKQGEEQRKIRQKIYYAVEEVQNES